MNRLLSKVLVATCCLLNLAVAATLPAPPQIAAKAYMLVDLSTNQILAESADTTAAVEPASLTKLMTGYLVFDALKSNRITLQQKLPVSERAWRMPGSRMFIDPKMQVSVDDLLKGMVVQSGNDATVALAEGVGGSYEYFVQLMNQKAKQLGLQNTSYKNPEGLTEAGHYTSVHDLALLSISLIRDHPEYLDYSALKEWHYPRTPASNRFNRNRLLQRDASVDGLKTGHTNAAGYCLVATAQREQHGVQRRLLSVVVGAASEEVRAIESQKLLNWGYMAYEAVELFKPQQEVAKLPLWKGSSSTLTVGFVNGLSVAVPTGQADKVTTEIVLEQPIVAPIKQQQVVAKLQVKLDQQIIREIKLASLQEIEAAGFFGRMWDGFLMLFSS